MARHNFTDVPEPRDFTDLPKGHYPVRVVKVEAGWAERSGAREWIITWSIVENRYIDKDNNEREFSCAGRTIRDWFRFDDSSELGYGRIKHILSVLGVDIEDVDDGYPEILLGRECWAPMYMKEKEVIGRDGKPVMRCYPNFSLVGFRPREGWQVTYEPVPPSKTIGLHQDGGGSAPSDPFQQPSVPF